MADRTPILYLAPWVDYGGSDKGTIDWFRWLHGDRFALSLVTTQPSDNRRLGELVPYAEEVWPLPDVMRGDEFPGFIFDLIESRGVELIHVMNSRLGFLLLPELSHLSRPPAVVVQLHAEESESAGYVRYVTTRYGSLVDAFSLTNRHLADAVAGYGIPRSKCRVIYTGVDAEREFAPERHRPAAELDDGVANLLFPARLTAQKDPLLMVEVADALRRLDDRFRIQVLGDGELRARVEESVAARGLDRFVEIHPPTPDLGPWYAGARALLLTSVFEGVPYTAFEAMAMATPVVAPALPGIEEIVQPEHGRLVKPRDDPQAYAEALAELLEDPGEARRCGERARETVRERYSLRRMAGEHARLYEELLERRARESGSSPAPGAKAGRPAPAPLQLAPPPRHERPLVSVVIPCYDHGRYLDECLQSIRGQSYSAIETILVDDGSTEPDTVAAMERLAGDPDLTVLRLPDNRGPGAARNAGIARASGGCILPLDADDLLLPGAIERLVDQLQGAGERIGYIYPTGRYFGTRTDDFESPDFNLDVLLRVNFAASCSLFDGQIFAAGIRYAEDIALGHEDWDFVLQLADRGVYGEPAAGDVLLYRQWGFSRSHEVEHGATPFAEEVRARHPRLYEPATRRRIKSRWSPALSLIALEPVEPGEEAGHRLRRGLHEQSCQDFEMLVASRARWSDGEGGPHVRQLSADPVADPRAMLEEALAVARGRFLIVTEENGCDLLANRALVEQVLRTLGTNSSVVAIAFADPGRDDDFPFRLISADEEASPFAVAWRAGATPRSDPLPEILPLRAGHEVESLVRGLARAVGSSQWRVAPRERPAAERVGSGSRVTIRRRVARRPSERFERELRFGIPPDLPGSGRARIPRWGTTWTPPESVQLFRHREPHTETRIVSTDLMPPPGFSLELALGSAGRYQALGATPLAQLPGPMYVVGERAQREIRRRGADDLGHLELDGLPLMDALELAHDPLSGQQVLVAGPEDPLRGKVEVQGTLGYLEPYPIRPRRLPHEERRLGALGLTRGLDRRARRHRYALGKLPEGELIWELGALADEPGHGWLGLYQDAAGRVSTDAHPLLPKPVRLGTALRWTIAPLSWGRVAPFTTRLRATVRRGFEAIRYVGRRPTDPPATGEPVGYLAPEPGPQRLAVYAAVHPVTGDQLLTRSRLEATELGYGQPSCIGYAMAYAPLTGSLESRPHTVPWAAKFGTTVSSAT